MTRLKCIFCWNTAWGILCPCQNITFRNRMFISFSVVMLVFITQSIVQVLAYQGIVQFLHSVVNMFPLMIVTWSCLCYDRSKILISQLQFTWCIYQTVISIQLSQSLVYLLICLAIFGIDPWIIVLKYFNAQIVIHLAARAPSNQLLCPCDIILWFYSHLRTFCLNFLV